MFGDGLWTASAESGDHHQRGLGDCSHLVPIPCRVLMVNVCPIENGECCVFDI